MRGSSHRGQEGGMRGVEDATVWGLPFRFLWPLMGVDKPGTLGPV